MKSLSLSLRFQRASSWLRPRTRVLFLPLLNYLTVLESVCVIAEA